MRYQKDPERKQEDPFRVLYQRVLFQRGYGKSGTEFREREGKREKNRILF